MVKLWYPNLWNERGIFNWFIIHKQNLTPHTPSREEGENATGKESFWTKHRAFSCCSREDTTRKKLLSSFSWEKLFLEPPLLKPLSAQFPELPGGKVTRRKRPMENEDPAAQLWLTALLAVPQHHEMPAFGKSHCSDITNRHTSARTTKRIWDSTIKILPPLITTSQAPGRH